VKTLRQLLKHCLLAALLLAAGSGHAQSVTKIAAGGWCSFFIKSNGSLWAMGKNDSGELGDGTLTNHFIPEQIVAAGVAAISAHDPNLFLKTDGGLWGMGDNSYGGLGDGTTTNRNSPELILSNGVVAVSGSNLRSFFLKSDGSLWGMGFSDYGVLGDGTSTSSGNFTNRPEQIVSSGVVAVAGAFTHSLFIKSDGSLWGMGDNGYGELVDTTTNEYDRPVQIISSGVTAVAAADWFTLFIKSDGSLWGMGYNGQGQLGDGTTTDRHSPVCIVSNGVTAVAAGDEEFGHSLFLKSDGSLWGMGYNFYGVLGDGSAVDRSSPVKIVPSGVVTVATGAEHTLFLKTDGSLWGMGYNADGELGDGTLNNTNRPELIVAGVSATNLTATNWAFANKLFRFTLTGPAGSNAVIAASTNLLTWTPLVTNPLGSGTLSFTDAVATNFPRRFYRAALTP